jgi:hypothetical protein
VEGVKSLRSPGRQGVWGKEEKERGKGVLLGGVGRWEEVDGQKKVRRERNLSPFSPFP